MAVFNASNEGKNLRYTSSILLGKSLDLFIVTNSKDLYTSLSTKRKSIDRSIHADINLIQYAFETGYINNIVGIPGATNTADSDTKKDICIAEPLRIMLHSAILTFDFRNAKSRTGNRSFW